MKIEEAENIVLTDYGVVKRVFMQTDKVIILRKEDFKIDKTDSHYIVTEKQQITPK